MTFITILNFTRRYYWIVQGIIILALVLFLKKEKRKTEDYQEIYDLQQMEIKKWKDDTGKNRMRASIVEIDATNAKLLLEYNLQEAIRKEVGNLKRNLISYSSIQSSTSGTFQTYSVDTIYVLDRQMSLNPLPAKRFAIAHPSLKFTGLYVPSLDTLIARYKIIHNFEIFHYYKRPGKEPFNLFRRKQAVVEIKFNNPDTQGHSLYSVMLERKKGFLNGLFN